MNIWVKAAVALAALAAILAIGFSRGYASADTKWQARWDARNASDAKALRDRDAAAIPKVTQEGIDYAKATTAPVTDAPHVLVCPSAPAATHAVRAPASAPSVPDAAPAIRAAAPRDIGAPVVTVGRDANAQVAGLQAYIRDVCQR